MYELTVATGELNPVVGSDSNRAYAGDGGLAVNALLDGNVGVRYMPDGSGYVIVDVNAGVVVDDQADIQFKIFAAASVYSSFKLAAVLTLIALTMRLFKSFAYQVRRRPRGKISSLIASRFAHGCERI